MAAQHPPQLAAALKQTQMMINSAEGREIDLEKTPWVDIEKSVIKVLQGSFKPNEQAHQIIAIGLTAVLATRLMNDQGAFWFLNRDTPEGMSLGFTDAMVTFGPFSAVTDSLLAAKMERLDEIQKQIRDTLAQAKFGGGMANRPKLRPEDYQRLFDPGFVQLLAVDETRKAEAFKKTPVALSVELAEAIGRSKLPENLKKQVDQQLVTTLRKLDPSKPFIDQARQGAERLAEVVCNLFAVKTTTGAAPDEFFQEMLFPLLMIGTPTNFPPIEGDDLESLKQGNDPFFVFLEVVPFQYSIPEEQAVFGVFDAAKIKLLDAEFSGQVSPRMFCVDSAILKEPLQHFSPAAVKATIEKFYAYCKQVEPKAPAAPSGEVQKLIDLALTVTQELKRVFDENVALYVRRMTEAEAQSEAAFEEIRKGLTGSRIILLS